MNRESQRSLTEPLKTWHEIGLTVVLGLLAAGLIVYYGMGFAEALGNLEAPSRTPTPTAAAPREAPASAAPPAARPAAPPAAPAVPARRPPAGPRPVAPARAVTRAAPAVPPTVLAGLDLRRVDPGQLLRRLTPHVLRIAPTAVLAEIQVSGAPTGLADVTSVARLHYQFRTSCRVGGAEVHDPLVVEIAAGAARIAPGGTARCRGQQTLAITPLLPPTCSSVQALGTATRSGLRPDARTRIRYVASPFVTPRPDGTRVRSLLPVWRFTVDGQPTQTRAIHGATCALVFDASRAPAVPKR